ncbi:MAG: pyridoxamine 5'-phosphate oxidase family protein [Planctomycetes bacterium]|nr:pyridoxamine 5'-phosphate oxidase family protein [Planctomycetota bacterium]
MNAKTAKQEQFFELLRSFTTAMLTTRSLDGELRARPMAIARVAEDASVWFATDVTSMKVDEIAKAPRVNVSFQSRDTFLSLSGFASVHDDRKMIGEYWQSTWNIWFPDGPEDPRLALLRVQGQYGEYWDMSGLKSVAYLWQAGRSLLTGEPPQNVGDHDKVKLS